MIGTSGTSGTSGSNRRGRRLDGADIELVVRGRPLGAPTIEYARRRVSAAARTTHRPVTLARLTLTLEGRPANPKRMQADVLLDVDGHTVLAHASGRSIRAAIDRLERRLRRRLVADANHRSWRGADRGEEER